MTVRLRNDTIAGVEAELGLMRTAKLAIDPTGPVMLRLAAGQRIALEFTAVPQGWGAHAVGPLVGVGLAAVLVALGSAARSSTPVHAGVALLGAMLLLRHDARLMLAPLYGAGLLLVDELATRSIELAGVRAIGPGVASTRAAAVLAVAALGGCAGAVAAIAVTAAPGRSVMLTATGAIAIVIVFAAIVRHARHSYPVATDRHAELDADRSALAGGGCTGRG